MPEPVVSVVIPARNEASSIGACVEALLAAAPSPGDFEILVVDGRSDDQTRAVVQAIADRDPRVRLLDNPGRITPIALNLGIRAARGEVIARMDGHTTPPADYLFRGLTLLRETGAWCVGGSMTRVGDDPVRAAIGRATMSPFGVGDAIHNYATEPQDVETVYLGMWPRWVFQQVGLFDEELARNQDDELSYRIRAAGGRIRMDPGISMHYRPRGSFRALFRQYREYAMWKVRVFQKHPGAARWRHVVPAAWIGVMVGGAALTPLTVVAPAAAGSAAVAYAALMAAAARRLGTSQAPATLIFRALVTLHLAYGVGFWQGLVRFAPRWFSGRSGHVDLLEARR